MHSGKLRLACETQQTQLMLAVWIGDIDLVKQLLAQGTSVNETVKDGYTVLMCAAYYGHPEIVRSLLRHGANKDNVSKKGETALSIAEKKKFGAVAELLRP
jgi:ankyrin repeat protein